MYLLRVHWNDPNDLAIYEYHFETESEAKAFEYALDEFAPAFVSYDYELVA